MKKRDEPVEAAVTTAKSREPAGDAATLQKVPELLRDEPRQAFSVAQTRGLHAEGLEVIARSGGARSARGFHRGSLTPKRSSASDRLAIHATPYASTVSARVSCRARVGRLAVLGPHDVEGVEDAMVHGVREARERRARTKGTTTAATVA